MRDKEVEKACMAELLRAAEREYKQAKRCNDSDWPQAYAEYMIEQGGLYFLGAKSGQAIHDALDSYRVILSAQQKSAQLAAAYEEAEHNFTGRLAQLDELLQLFE